MSPALSASEQAALREFLDRVRSMLGPELREARLFGSRARGEGHEHSDLDIALIVGEQDARGSHCTIQPSRSLMMRS